ncbi:putative holliday junction DNA helicase RuvA (chromatophore) [Paulinella micropora]|uniref:Holliday junction DNA helicase RuvA n=1 Tax=Paulinella micropora TaxID=1928728 RepID=A0A1L5YBF2_9EUKA|nr:putative holliday junction DNA helicase RuvA [Paulinella micropora]AQX44793.1 putative holliday junction DNA helicase RuvA [Paulinella micropora]BBL86006.1 putative holliday junction DNA helicase RuvA [Paulinella micropora]
MLCFGKYLFKVNHYKIRALDIKYHKAVETFSMITWLEGKLLERWKKGARVGIVMNCNGIGYEVYVNHRDWECLPRLGERLALHTYMIIREKQWTLYGFANRYDRDLFGELISISGIGPQIAISLQSTLGHVLLVNAIVNGDLEMLSKAQGIGKRVAEKLSVELRSRLTAYCQSVQMTLSSEETCNNKSFIDKTLIIELESVLRSLGYENLEIQQAIKSTQVSSTLNENSDFDSWFREVLCTLDQQTI